MPDEPAILAEEPTSYGSGALTPDDVARLPAPGQAIPAAVTFSSSGTHVTFLHAPDGSLERNLERLDVVSGERRTLVGGQGGDTEATLTAEERLRRERAREMGVGVTRYLRAEQSDRILLPRSDGLWVLDGDQPPRAVPAGSGPFLDPQLSPDGRLAGFVRDGELHVVELASGEVRRVTSGADEAAGITHGLAEFVAQEEMGRPHGYWWSRDGRWLAWTEVDESPIPWFRIAHLASSDPGAAADERHRYPFAGEANASVRLAVSPVAGGPPLWLDLGADTPGRGASGRGARGGADQYLARVHWMPDGSLVTEVESRDQQRLDLWRHDPETGDRRHLLTEESDVWVNLHDLFRPLAGGGFVWGSERTGFRHLLLCDDRGRVIRPLTSGAWQVDALEGIDEAGGMAYFTGTAAGPLERHLYCVPLGGGSPRRITTEPGTHQVVVDRACERFVDTWSALDRPWTVQVRDLRSGARLHTLHDTIDPRIAALGLEPPRLFQIQVDRDVTLHGAVYAPASTAATSRRAPPGVVSVYGGPHAQRVTNSWTMTADLRAQLLRQEGFCVVVLDNRGSARRGLAFEGAIRHDLGRLEVADQAAGVAWAAGEGLLDPARVAIYGWSYGGYMAAMALARAPDVFAAGVAGAPVTSWDGYDTHYTERYMGTPADNPSGYRDSAVMTHVAAVRGPLLLIHGLIDENVHFRHTARLVQALINAGRHHELLMFPEERHVPRSEKDRASMEARILRFLRQTIVDARPVQ